MEDKCISILLRKKMYAVCCCVVTSIVSIANKIFSVADERSKHQSALQWNDTCVVLMNCYRSVGACTIGKDCQRCLKT